VPSECSTSFPRSTDARWTRSVPASHKRRFFGAGYINAALQQFGDVHCGVQCEFDDPRAILYYCPYRSRSSRSTSSSRRVRTLDNGIKDATALLQENSSRALCRSQTKEMVNPPCDHWTSALLIIDKAASWGYCKLIAARKKGDDEHLTYTIGSCLGHRLCL
jgi:hypothetical protein